MAAVGRREAILDAALHLFAEQTFAASRMSDLVGRADVGAGTVYRYFSGKEALGNEVFRKAKTEMYESVFSAAVDGATFEQRFGQLWRRLGWFAREHPEAYAFLEMQEHASYLDQRSRQEDLRVRAAARGFVQEGQADGAIAQGSPDVLVALVLGAMNGVFRAWQSAELQLDDGLITEAGRRVWRLLAAEPTPGGPG